MQKTIVPLIAIALLATVAAAQVGSPNVPPSNRPAATAPASVQPASTDVVSVLPQLNQVIDNARLDLARLRIDKWKTSGSDKRQAQENSEALQRNMSSAWPAITEQVRANPASLGASFKLYRNLNALYDVLASLTESAGAFGSKEEYQALASDAANLDNLRRSMADRVEAQATAHDAQLARMQTQARQAAAAPPKKIVIDDTEPAHKTAKKSPTKKKTTSTAEQSPPKSQQ
ncbi:MAG: hypothetical protein ACR2IF_18970 [Terriglobales bacterium]